MENYVEIKNNESSICAKCNGYCCRHMGCELHPQDVFGKEIPTIEKLIEFLSCGLYQIDCWDGDIREDMGIDIGENDEYYYRSYYLRPKHTNSNRLFNASWGGTCIFFEDGKGCKLDWQHRPYGGKALVANEEKKCHSSYGKVKAALDWLPYHDMIEDVLDAFIERKADGTFLFDI